MISEYTKKHIKFVKEYFKKDTKKADNYWDRYCQYLYNETGIQLPKRYCPACLAGIN